MLYIMFTRSPKWFNNEGRPPLPTTQGDDGKPAEDMKQVAKWYFNGQRPVFGDLQASDRLFDSFPPLLRLLIEGCWAGKQADRLHFKEIESLLDASLGWLDMPEPKPKESYDDWLANLGLHNYKDELAHCGLDEGLELQQLREMDDSDLNDDILSDEDLGLDDDAKTRFRVAVSELASSSTAGASSDSAVADDGPARMRLVSLLPKSGTEKLLAAKDEELARQMEDQAKETAAKDEANAANAEEIAEKDKELKQLRAQLQRLEGVPPQ